MSNQPIGVLDSGSGGLSIWNTLCTSQPYESVIYVGDHANLPYSGKTTQFIRRRVTTIIRYMLQLQVKLVVIACNTATVAGIEYYRRLFPGLPIVGVVPVVKTAAKITKTGTFAVLSTEYTSRSSYQKKLIADFAHGLNVYNLGCPNLVAHIESGVTDSPLVREELRSILGQVADSHCDVLALGCTHYPFLRLAIRDIVGKEVVILDSSGAVSRQVARILAANGLQNSRKLGSYLFVTTGDAGRVSQIASKLLQRPVKFDYVQI